MNRYLRRLIIKLVGNELKQFVKMATRSQLYLGNNLAITRTIYGHKIIVDTTDLSLAPHILLDGYWERNVSTVLLKSVKRGMIVVDVGANIGYYTLLAATQVGPEGKVYAFEADPDLIHILNKNVEINGFKNRAKIIGKAVYNKSQTLTLHKLTNHKGSSSLIGFSKEFVAEYDDTVTSIPIETISLDEFFGDTKIDLIKIDAEGSEPYILNGMKNLCMNNRQLIIILEFAPAFLTGINIKPLDYLNTLQDMGFTLEYIDEFGNLIKVEKEELIKKEFVMLYLTKV